MTGRLMLIQDNAERMQPRPRAQIRSNVSLPPKRTPGVAQEFPNLRAMKVGDSFELLNRPAMTPARLVNAVDKAIRRRKWGETKWKIRQTATGVGVWRMQ